VKTAPIRGHAPAERTKNQIWHKGSRRRCNYLFQIVSKSVKGFPRSQKWGSSIEFNSRPYRYKSALPCCLW